MTDTNGGKPALRTVLEEQRWWPYLLLGLGAFFLASDVIVGRSAGLLGLPPLGLGFWRVAGPALLLTPFFATEIYAKRALILRHWYVFALLGLSVSLFGGVSLYLGLSRSTALNAGVVSTAQAALTVFWGWALFRDRITPRQGVGLAVAAAGVLMVVARGDLGALLALRFNLGDLLIFVAITGFAVYAVVLRLTPRGLSLLAMLCVINWFGALFSAPLYAWEIRNATPFPYTPTSLAMIVWLSLFVSIVAIGCLTKGALMLGSYVAGVFNYVRTLFIALLAIAVLGERVATYHLVGVALICAGIYLMTVVRRRGATRSSGSTSG